METYFKNEAYSLLLLPTSSSSSSPDAATLLVLLGLRIKVYLLFLAFSLASNGMSVITILASLFEDAVVVAAGSVSQDHWLWRHWTYYKCDLVLKDFEAHWKEFEYFTCCCGQQCRFKIYVVHINNNTRSASTSRVQCDDMCLDQTPQINPSILCYAMLVREAIRCLEYSENPSHTLQPDPNVLREQKYDENSYPSTSSAP